MKIIFMGTPDFAVPTLKKIHDMGHEVGLVVTRPDQQRDRGKKVKFPPVKEKALELGIPVTQPEKVKDNQKFYEKLKDYNPDVIVVVAYGMLLPKEILDIPKKGCLNVHASLLPKFRGAAPIQWAIVSGEEETGVTIMNMEEGMDTGGILGKVATPIQHKTGADLHEELSHLGGILMEEILSALTEGMVAPTPQDDSKATYAPMISKKDGEIDFTQDGMVIDAKIRGFFPWPGAFTYYEGKVMKILAGQKLETKYEEKPGTIVDVNDKGILVATGGAGFLIEKIQMPGKKAMAVAEYIKGNPIEKFSVLG